MQSLRYYINPKQFVITVEQIAKLLGIDPQRILNWEAWYNVLWVHIEGVGGRFVSYRRLAQWIAACSTRIRFCRTLDSLKLLWQCIEKESERYTNEAFSQLTAIARKRHRVLSNF